MEILYVVLAEECFDFRSDAFEVGEPFGVLLFGCPAQPFVFARREIFERDVFELAAHVVHAEAVGERRIDFARLERDANLLCPRQRVERHHVVQAVGELDEHDAQVLRDCEDHLAHVFSAAFLSAIFQSAELCHAIDEERDFVAELFADSFERRACVFDGVVEEACGDGRIVHSPLAQDLCGREDVVEVGLATFAFLAPVRFFRERERTSDDAIRMLFEGFAQGHGFIV